jgi:[NiFe] hydrogenase diaphorase moiety large subunit
LDIVSQFLQFFCEESCGYCTPCRVGTRLMKEQVDDIREGAGGDLAALKRLSETIKLASRCGLGQTAPNPVLSSLTHFPDRYAACLSVLREPYAPGFRLKRALAQAEVLAGRPSSHGSNGGET